MSSYLSQILYTIVAFAFFVTIIFITYRKGAKQGYDDIGREIIEDDDDVHLDEAHEEGKNGSDHHNGAKNE